MSCDFDSHSWQYLYDTALCDKVYQGHGGGAGLEVCLGLWGGGGGAWLEICLGFYRKTQRQRWMLLDSYIILLHFHFLFCTLFCKIWEDNIISSLLIYYAFHLCTPASKLMHILSNLVRFIMQQPTAPHCLWSSTHP